ncbi:hypothetical protein IU433_13965 [Nocardia puris]|uniref:glycine-rich domain-containing protein n=1 Tax=Nocardia puris TaxID=208602 RepID=UPI0018938E48|nr:hypothetical protein [Nocardia puris]MBF6460142.1 hypothetical protein [Nocardia puris]
MAVLAILRVYTGDSVWSRPAGLRALDIIVRGAGGSGSETVGGGGGALTINTQRRISPLELPATCAITVGLGGTNGGDGGASSFGDLLIAPGGRGGLNGGGGGLTFAPGGRGGAAGQPGQTVTSGVVRLLAAGGGGAGSGSTGGGSGRVPGGTTLPPFWEWCQSGGGGHSGQPGGYPSGGGGAGAAGAHGLVTVIEYYTTED